MQMQKLKAALFVSVLFSIFVTTSPAASAYAGSVTGTVIFDGAAPEMKEIKMDSDPYCLLQHPEPTRKETAVVDSNGGLKYVFVYIKEGEELDAMIEGGEIETPTQPVVLDQKGCHYEPHVFGMMAGQPLEIRNSDQTLHNIHAMPTGGGAFNIGMPGKPEPWSLTKTFKEPEVMVLIKCDVHSWMNSYAGVLKHPFYSVTNDQGSFHIESLPPGNYVLEAWHEKLGTQQQNITVVEGAPVNISFHFAAPEQAPAA